MNEDFTDMLPMSDAAIAGQVEALKHVRQADKGCACEELLLVAR